MLDKTPLLAGGNVRRGTRVCGCDSRRGTIAVKCLDIAVTIVIIVCLTVMYKDEKNKPADQGEGGEEGPDRKYYLTLMIVSGITLAMNILVIVGAALYNRRLVVIGMVWIVIELILTLVLSTSLLKHMGRDVLEILYIVGPIAWTGIQLWPQAVYVTEVSTGTMSPLTYHREARCCCCV